MSPKKKVTILGSTGSVGINTLSVIRDFSSRFEVAGLAAGTKLEELESQIREFRPASVYLKDSVAAHDLMRAGGKPAVFTEKEGMKAFCRSHDFDILVAASSGTSALLSVIDALERGKRVALANKEILVMAGALVMETLKKNPAAELLPVDSEHSAIFQCLAGTGRSAAAPPAVPKAEAFGLLGASAADIRRLVLTGSGGPLREVPSARFAGISKDVVTAHPKWKMGKKISVDSATMMNKGLEIIEAAWLFGVPVDRIDVLIHPEAVIHSMVEFNDGSLLAQLGVTDMRLPIQYAMCYPDRPAAPSTRRLDFATLGQLSFGSPDRKKFPCLDLAYEAARRSGSAPCVLSAADEVAVSAFLEDRIDFTEIPGMIEKVLSKHRHVERPSLQEIQSIHDWAVNEANQAVARA